MKAIKSIAIAITSIFFTFSPSWADNQDVPDTLSHKEVLNRFAGWTEERFKEYEDSIFSVMYPPLNIGYSDSTLSEEVDFTSGRHIEPRNIIANPTRTTATIDTSKPVGEIPIVSGRTIAGAKTYDIPISVAQGMNGFQPALSLSYNSQRGNSVMGMGWAVSGISSITRGNKSLYYDDKAEGVRNDTTDAFFLDGQRLIKKSKTSTIINYESEIGFIKVRAYYTDNVIRYFEVYYPDGRKGVFGYSSNTVNRLEYPMVSQRDLNSNIIQYTYTFDNNHYDISNITYNTSASVTFTYTNNRPEILESFRAGIWCRVTRLLQKVTCQFNNQTLGEYTLTYTTKNHLSLLTQIDYGANSQTFNPIRFDYGEDLTAQTYTQSNTQIFESYYTIDSQTGFRVQQGRFDYINDDDGIAVFPNREPYFKYYRPSSTSYFGSLYDVNTNIYFYAGLQDTQTSLSTSMSTGTGFVDLLFADLQGKGTDFVIKINDTVNDNNNTDQVTFKAYHPNSISVLSLWYNRTFSFPTVYSDGVNKSIQPKFYYTGDFNGDGKMEVFAVSAHQPLLNDTRPSVCYLFDIVGNNLLFEGTVFPFVKEFLGDEQPDAEAASNNSDKCFVIDYDGDGKSDICHINSQGTDVYTFDITPEGYSLRKVATYTGLSRSGLSNRTFYPCDFNGDGLTDILVSPNKESSTDALWRIIRSKGDGQFVGYYFTGPSSYANTYHICGDVNGDKKPDIISVSSSSFTTYFNHDNEVEAGIYTSFPYSSSILIPFNFSERKQSTRLLCLKNNIITKYFYPRNERKEAMITGMTNSLGVVDVNKYCLFEEQDSLFSTDWTGLGIPSFPYVLIPESSPLLAQSETYLNGNRTDKNSFNYFKPTYHFQGRGFCGFQKVAEKDVSEKIKENTYLTDEFGLLKTETKMGFFDCYYSYSIEVQANKQASILLTEKAGYDYLTNLSDTTTYSYDSFCHPVTERTVFSDGNVINKQFVYDNNNVMPYYYLGFVKTQITKYTRAGKPEYKERMHVNSHDRCKPLNVAYYKNNSIVKRQFFTYDSHGNVLTEAYNGDNTTDTLTTTHVYDTYGRCTRTTDPMGFATDYTYDSRGLLSTETDHRGGVTTHQYDSFGREISVTNPDTTIITNTFEWSSEGTNGVYSITRAETGKPTVKTVYDAMKREVRSSTQRFNNSYLNTDKLYTNKGQLWKESLPFKSSSPSLWKVYSYDTKDRLTSIEEPSGRTTTYSYSGMSTTTTEDGIATTRTYDSLGGLTSVIDPGGTITYDLDSDGQPSSITAPGNVVTSFTYDLRRRRTAISDPSAGTTTYTYYSLSNNVKYETDANGKKKSYYYDRYGRVTRITLPEFYIWYNYNSLNELTSVYCTNGTYRYRYFTYDVHGRVKTVKEQMGSDWLKKEYFYSAGKTDSIQYSTQSGFFVTERNVYANGNFKEGRIQNPNGTNQLSVVNIDSENALGQTTRIYTGGHERIYTYSSYGYPILRRTVSIANTLIQFYASFFDAQTGNMSSRRRMANVEYFSYDNLNRLTASDIITTSYDTKGNIINKSDMGSFTYSTPQKPYAISDATYLADSLLPPPQEIRYTSFHRPDSILQGDTTAVFAYNDQYDRVKMETTMSTNSGNVTVTDLYFGGCYEKHTEGNGTPIERLYLFGDYYSAPAVLIKQGNIYSLYYILRDYQGSITHVVAENGTVLQELNYDAWGRLRNPSTYQNYLPSDEPTLLLGRGYCGHEHLQKFGLINMNARLYDPMVCRFLSPDPYVQAPDNTQNFNRYSYCLNNPLKYTDESGELFIIDDFIFGMIKGAIKGENIFESGWKQASNSAKIWGGLFTTDSNKDIGGRVVELLSRFTWQLPQTVMGFGLAHAVNTFGTIHDIDYLYGTTVISSTLTKDKAAVTLGNYIVGSPNLKADPNNEIFQHEYGHYIQSQNLGSLYLLVIGLPSIISATNIFGEHKYSTTELGANYLAYNYFKKNVSGFEKDSELRFRNSYYNKGWENLNNPLYSKKENEKIYKFQWYYNMDAVESHLPSIYPCFHY